jgi:hypothetical protein
MKCGFIYLVVSLLFMSCAAIGTKFSLYDKEAPQKIRRVVLFSKTISSWDQVTYSYGGDLMMQTLLSKLIESGYFNIIPPDTVTQYMHLIDKSDTTYSGLLKVADTLSADAIIIAHYDIKFNRSSRFLPDERNAEVSLLMVDAKSGALILETKHDTFKGNSYFNPPSLEKSTVDACEGALKPIFEYWKLNKK